MPRKFIEEFMSDGLIADADAIDMYNRLLARGFDDEQARQMMAVMVAAMKKFAGQEWLPLSTHIVNAVSGKNAEQTALKSNLELEHLYEVTFGNRLKSPSNHQ